MKGFMRDLFDIAPDGDQDASQPIHIRWRGTVTETTAPAIRIATRSLPHALRRARLLNAWRLTRPRSAPRCALLAGFWDQQPWMAR